jgi:hypothetical protein
MAHLQFELKERQRTLVVRGCQILIKNEKQY